MIFIGLDIGSTAVKAIAIGAARGSDRGIVLGRGSSDYPTHRPTPDAALHDPLDWINSSIEAINSALSYLSPEQRKQIGGIGISAQAGSIYAADAQKRPISLASTWMDRTAASESANVIEAIGSERIRLACGWKPSATDCIAKLLMLKHRNPDLFSKAAYFYNPEETVTGLLCGNYVTDPTGASVTRLYDRRRGQYLPEVLELLGITENKLPAVAPCGSLAGTLKEDMAKMFDIPVGIPVFVGAHDQYCASIGSGITEPGEMLIATGTAWVVFGVTESPIEVPPNPPWCAHPIDGRFGFMISLSGCGGALGTFAGSQGSTPAALDREIAACGIKAVREKIADYYVCPLPPDPPLPHRDGVCGAIKISDGYTAAETALAAMEGAVFEARALVEAFTEAGLPKNGDIVVSGGASRSEVWMSILAAAFPERKIYRLCEADAPAVGAALIAATSGGAYSSLGEAAEAFSERLLVECDPEAALFYSAKYQRYRQHTFL